MKIAILTLVFNNYGTRLQSYALCKVLKRLGGEDASIKVVNMDTPWGSGARKSFVERFRKLAASFKGYGVHGFKHVAELFRWAYEYRRVNREKHEGLCRLRDESFGLINNKIPYTDHFTVDEVRKGCLDTYDVLLVGSDQVWNAAKVPNQDIFLLDFAKKQKCLTYAASFGMTAIPDGMFELYKKGINRFESLLLREKEGLEMCKALDRNDAKVVLDPTLLLGYDDYQEIMDDGESPMIEGKYILLYSLNKSYRIYDEVYGICKRTGCKMVVLKRSFCPPSMERYEGSIELFAVSPGGCLRLIKNAECVITNSYHALLFSINFNISFYVYLDNADQENSRMLTILDMCGLDRRVYWETEALPKSVNKIDYGSVNLFLENQRRKSIEELKKAIYND